MTTTSVSQEIDTNAIFNCNPSATPLMTKEQSDPELASWTTEDPFKTFGQRLSQNKKNPIRLSTAAERRSLGSDAFSAFDTVKVRPSSKRPLSLDLELGSDKDAIFIEPLQLCQLSMLDDRPSGLQLPLKPGHGVCSKVAVGSCSHTDSAGCSRNYCSDHAASPNNSFISCFLCIKSKYTRDQCSDCQDDKIKARKRGCLIFTMVFVTIFSILAFMSRSAIIYLATPTLGKGTSSGL